MCAIYGFVAPRSGEKLSMMGIALRHRGPDESGRWESDQCSMGLERLAILDIEGGKQPCVSGEVVTVLNGEIYNFRALRRELEQKGHRFVSDHSDAELIPAAYREWGERFPEHLDGMFAIAVWDAARQKLLLVRDPAGKKPCYYGFRGDELYFASEIKALRAVGIGEKVSEEGLISFLSKKSVESPLSIFEAIVQLPPATVAVFKNGKKSDERRYWRPKFDGALILSDEEEYVELLDQALIEAVRKRCDMDVEYGAFLSGGIDSSLIATLSSKYAGIRLKTFTLAYEDSISGKDEDERFAAEVARNIGAERFVYRLGHAEAWNSMRDILGAFDEPFSATVSPYFLCGLVSKHVKAVLSGDGADELFGSYLTHRRSAQMDDGVLANEENSRWRASLSVFSDEELSVLFGKKVCGVPYAKAHNHAATQLHQTLESEFLTQLPDQVLKYADRLSMAHGVEVRSPFLDKRFIELAGHIPSALKIRGGEVKYILKKTALRHLPPELVFRPKEGFVLPVWRWMDTHWRDRVKENLLESDMVEMYGFSRPFMEKIVAEWAAGAPHHPKIWSLLMLSLWNGGRA